MQTTAVILFPALLAAGAVMMPAHSHASPPDANCTCRNRDGSKHEIGETVCIRAGDTAYLARCEMDLNVTTWRRLQDGCPTAGLRNFQTSFQN
ncbi:hypothetical protein P6U16_02715 [Rhizobium sp. 32-5/1]|uniref:hypothetical protein n=1 Tax=Rhizobium sp. 32-5/1 TaxID=3019602 RepID=UPI00240E660E|nr:hypothetical protein [Rhizobium sp. 32-5/1]WEZ83734.1 hypothetical protein P6U16_02715 [Rhizobium sp. 32-5/1]